MILDLDQMKKDGLDPEQLAADVARLMGRVWDERRCRICGWSLGDEGALHSGACSKGSCSMRPAPAQRADAPLPVDAVRMKLRQWLRAQSICVIATNYATGGSQIVLTSGQTKLAVHYRDLTDEALALGVAAVELFKEKG